MDLQHSLSELRRLGMHLDPREAADATERRRVRLNTRVYPVTRAVGFQLLLAAVIVHNAVVFGEVGWDRVLVLVGVAEAYLVLTWLALRRWFLACPAILGWDLSDMFLLTDLLIFGGAISASGGSLSYLWIVPILRVADHHTVVKSWVFAHLAPLTYGLAVLWTPRPPDAMGIEGDLLKMGVLYVAGLYIAWTGLPNKRFREQREAALAAGAGLLARLTERTEDLDAARRSRSALLQELSTGIRTSLIEIEGFSRFLLRAGGWRSSSEESYLERIHVESRAALRTLDGLAEGPTAPLWPRRSLNEILHGVAAEEAKESDLWQEPAILDLPESDVGIRADEARLKEMLRHTLAACRHFERGPPEVELEVDPATGMAEAVVLTCRTRLPAGAAAEELWDPFAASASANQRDRAARLELSIARSMAQSLGYEMKVAGGPAAVVLTVRLR